jgi:diguanylate cyclase (GGDEF)-like protein
MSFLLWLALVITVAALFLLVRYTFLLEQLAGTDSLTGLSNRREFDSRGEVAIRQSRRHSVALSLLLLDLDGLKQVNDCAGHAEGDRVLQQLAESVKQACRDTDIAVRWGGDEFAVLARGAESEGALLLARRIRAELRERQGAGGATVSIGVAELAPEEDGGLDELFDRADRALRRAKTGAGERIVFEAFPPLLSVPSYCRLFMSSTERCTACGEEGVLTPNIRYPGIFLCEDCHERSQPGEDRYDIGVCD